ncbi:thiol-disulfide oxidoreductase DCC family protein [Porticoccus sp.]|uniref:thiol-disulfide oxidoreductase DCC family protein n=1 Tax=Porticoccus sp. TaxID=2024853 RepID=UPI003F69776B
MVDQSSAEKLTVFYDGACPTCIRDRRTYEKLAGTQNNVCWVDITGAEAQLREAGIDARKALTELHVQDGAGNIFSEIDAYRLLMARVPLLKPIGWLIGLPLVRPVLSRLYHWWVHRRLTHDGRL